MCSPVFPGEGEGVCGAWCTGLDGGLGVSLAVDKTSSRRREQRNAAASGGHECHDADKRTNAARHLGECVLAAIRRSTKAALRTRNVSDADKTPARKP